jgi:hypothetical protein
LHRGARPTKRLDFAGMAVTAVVELRVAPEGNCRCATEPR